MGVVLLPDRGNTISMCITGSSQFDPLSGPPDRTATACARAAGGTPPLISRPMSHLGFSNARSAGDRRPEVSLPTSPVDLLGEELGAGIEVGVAAVNRPDGEPAHTR